MTTAWSATNFTGIEGISDEAYSEVDDRKLLFVETNLSDNSVIAISSGDSKSSSDFGSSFIPSESFVFSSIAASVDTTPGDSSSSGTGSSGTTTRIVPVQVAVPVLPEQAVRAPPPRIVPVQVVVPVLPEQAVLALPVQAVRPPPPRTVLASPAVVVLAFPM